MMTDESLISRAFQVFTQDAPEHARAWGAMVQQLAQAGALDVKSHGLAYVAVLAALGMHSGIPFHVRALKEAGASREEVISAVLVGLPAAGHAVTQALPAAVDAYDTD